MNGFEFRLSALLRICEGLARQEETRLLRLLSDRARLEVERDDIDSRKMQIFERQQRVMSQGVSGAEIHVAQEQAVAIEAYRGELDWKMQRLELEITAQRQRYTEAQRELEKLERLRATALDAWMHDSARHEQQRNDELFLLRRMSTARESLFN
jgi:flagellar export protein FliJ